MPPFTFYMTEMCVVCIVFQKQRRDATEKADIQKAALTSAAAVAVADEDDDDGEPLNVFDQFNLSQAQNADEIFANFKMRMGALRKSKLGVSMVHGIARGVYILLVRPL